MADIAQGDVSLHLTAVDYNANLEKKIINNAQLVIIASEHDFIPYDRIEIQRLLYSNHFVPYLYFLFAKTFAESRSIQ